MERGGLPWDLSDALAVQAGALGLEAALERRPEGGAEGVLGLVVFLSVEFSECVADWQTGLLFPGVGWAGG